MVTSRLFVYRFCASSVRFLFFTFVCVFLHAARYAYYVKYMCSAMATFLTFFCSELHGNNRCRVHHCFCFLSWLRLLKILRAYNVVIFVHTNGTGLTAHNSIPHAWGSARANNQCHIQNKYSHWAYIWCIYQYM